jgi:hypothetical protein
MVGPLNTVNARPVSFQNLCNDFCLQLKGNLPQQFCQDLIFLNDYVINNFYNFMTMLLCGQLVLNPRSYNEEPSQIEQKNPVDGAIVVFPEMVFVSCVTF